MKNYNLKFIEVTTNSGVNIVVNVDMIVTIFSHNGFTTIVMLRDGEDNTVCETIESVMDKIKHAKCI